MIVLVVVAIITIAAVPDGDSEAKEEGRHACMRFEADISYARSLSIARPDDPAILKLDGDNNRYWLARASLPDTPITHPQTGEPYLVQYGPGGNQGFTHVQMLACDFGGDGVLGFDAFGGTDQQTDAILQLSSAGANYEIAVAPVTADVTSTQGLKTTLGEGMQFVGGGESGAGGGGAGGGGCME